MNSQQAQEVAERERSRSGVPREAQLRQIEQRFIELAGPDRELPAPVRDLLVWAATFEFKEGARWVELAIDDRTGEVVRIERSR